MAKSSTPIRKSYLPPVWNDDVRMNAMFADFRNRAVNPHDWDAKLNFWKQLINDWCQENNQATFSVSSIRHAFTRNGRSPRGLNTVTKEMERQDELMTLASFLKSTSEPGWITWSFDIFIKRPLSYSWSLISNTIWPPQDNSSLEFVNINILRNKANAILDRHRSLVENGDEDNTVSFSCLAKHCRDICRNEKDLELCLLLLRKDKQLTLHKEQEDKVVKFISNVNEQASSLSQSEKAMVRLRMVKKTLEHQISLHESEIEKFKTEAKNQLKLGARSLAKAALQKKKQAEVQLKKKEHSLGNIEMLMNQLQDVGTQKAVLDALQAGSNAFKFGQKEGGLDLDKVDETMAEIQETLEAQEELQEILGKSLNPHHDVSELERELEDIMQMDDNEAPNDRYNRMARSDKETDQEELFNYPEVPTESPEKIMTSEKGKNAVRF